MLSGTFGMTIDQQHIQKGSLKVQKALRTLPSGASSTCYLSWIRHTCMTLTSYINSIIDCGTSIIPIDQTSETSVCVQEVTYETMVSGFD